MTATTKRVIAYSRVSTEEQGVSGLGLEAQRAALELEVTRRGWLQVLYMKDEGKSGKNLNRPAIATALAALSAGEADVLVVAKLDRLSRSLLDFATLMEQARREGWELVVLDLNIDTSSPSGALMANVLASFSEYERMVISQRTSAALQAKKAQGCRLGRPVTLDEALVRRICELRRQGMSTPAIAALLNQERIATAHGGKRWYPSTISAVLRSASLSQAAS